MGMPCVLGRVVGEAREGDGVGTELVVGDIVGVSVSFPSHKILCLNPSFFTAAEMC